MSIELSAFTAASLLFAACLLLSFAIASRGVNITPTLAAASFAIIAFYLVLSGSVSELTGGGFSVKLKQISSIQLEDQLIEHGDIVGTEALGNDLEAEAFFQRAQRVIAIDGEAWNELPDGGRLRKTQIIATSIYQSLLSGGFQGLLVTDRARKPVGFFEASYFLDLLRLPLDRAAIPLNERENVLSDDEILSRLKETNLFTLMRNPVVRAEREGNKVWVEYNEPAVTMFRRIRENNLESVILVDFRGQYVGAVSRDKVTAQILSALLDPRAAE